MVPSPVKGGTKVDILSPADPPTVAVLPSTNPESGKEEEYCRYPNLGHRKQAPPHSRTRNLRVVNGSAHQGTNKMCRSQTVFTCLASQGGPSPPCCPSLSTLLTRSRNPSKHSENEPSNKPIISLHMQRTQSVEIRLAPVQKSQETNTSSITLL